MKIDKEMKHPLMSGKNLGKSLKIITSLFLLLFFIQPNAQAVVVLSDSTGVTTLGNELLSKKEQKKIRRWKKRLAKWTKKKEGKDRKNKFGRLGLLILLLGLISLFLTDVFFLLSLLGALVLGVIGLVKDENKTAAIFSVALPVAMFVVVLIAVASLFGE